jgi:DNA polymerase-3 subunit delta'
VIGHRRLIALLSRAIERATLPPTLLFAGPSGVGKWRTAVATAQAINCLQHGGATQVQHGGATTVQHVGATTVQHVGATPVQHGGATRVQHGGATRVQHEGATPPVQHEGAVPYDACGRCRACDRIARGVHVDVIAVEPDEKASIKIDVIRDVLARTAYRPFEGRKRVVLVREADTLEPSSQNALLKSLEEPPPSTSFILTTAAPGALLPTVKSRAMTLGFGPLTPAEVASVLVRDHGRSESDARTTALLAGGSVGQALAIDADDLAILRETALLLLQETSRRTDAQGRLGVAAAVVTGPSKKERSREELATILRLSAAMLRDIEVINSRTDPAVLANPVVRNELEAIAPRFSGDRARDAFAAVDRALYAVERNAGAKVVAEWLALQM